MAKSTVADHYERVATAADGVIERPVGLLDYNTDSARLLVGGLDFQPSVETLLRYHGEDLIRVRPAVDERPPAIDAVFTDSDSEPVLQLQDNEWSGSTEAWDITVIGQCITVRRALGDISLILRLEPPGTLIIERLDMRVGYAHLLTNRHTYAVGIHLPDESNMWWAHVNVSIDDAAPTGAAIEFTTPEEIERRKQLPAGSTMSNPQGIELRGGVGVLIPQAGLSIASGCGPFRLQEFACGTQSLKNARKAVFHGDPNELGETLVGKSN